MTGDPGKEVSRCVKLFREQDTGALAREEPRGDLSDHKNATGTTHGTMITLTPVTIE